MNAEEPAGLAIPARTIPVPKSISPQAQAILAGAAMFGGNPAPSGTDKEEWRAHIALSDKTLAAFVAAKADAFPGEIATHDLSACTLYEITPKTLSAKNAKRAILYIHGGGFVVGGGIAAAHAAMQIGHLAQTRIFSVDYRMLVDHPFPDGLNDCVEAYRWVLERYKPQNIAVYGPSAGGNLAPASLLKARDLGLPLPAACVMHSPVSDIAETGDTYETNAVIDVVLQKRMTNMMTMYANGHDLTDPYLSPMHGDYSGGFPPSLMTSGTRDLLLSSTVLQHRAMRRGGVKAELHVFEAMTHGGFFGMAPEDQEMLEEQVSFMLAHMGAE